MIRKPLRFVFGLFMGKKAGAVIAEGVDGLAKKAIDSKTRGAASKLDDVL